MQSAARFVRRKRSFDQRWWRRRLHSSGKGSTSTCRGDMDMSVTSQSDSRSERLGRWLARTLKSLLRQEVRFTRWLVAQGMPPWLAAGLLWLLKIALVVVVGFALFWLALILAVAFVAVRILAHADLDPEPSADEWRHGAQGYGLYNRNGDRIIPYDPTEDP
jgi:hypothetical protein